jgi:hypothetical protein
MVYRDDSHDADSHRKSIGHELIKEKIFDFKQ